MTACTGQSNFQPFIMGGYGLFGDKYVYKAFVNVPSHYQVEVHVNDYLVDSWDSENFYVKVDSTQIISRQYSYHDLSTNYCGSSSYADSIENYDSGTTSHTSSTLTIKFTCDLDQNRDDESYGFKDFYVYLITNCDNSCLTCSGTTSTSCTSCPALAALSSGKCVCKDKFYMSATPYTHCEKCHISCKTCSGGASTQCSSCYIDFTLSSSNTCVNSYSYQTTAEFSSSTFGATTLSSWSVAGSKVVSTQCHTQTMVGGPYNYDGSDWLQNSYTISLPHYQVGVYVDFYKIDNWNGQNFMILGGTSGSLTTMSTTSFSQLTDNTYARSLCAGCQNEAFQDFYVTTPFTGSTFTVKFSTSLGSQSNAYWGVNNFQLTIYECWPTCLTCSDYTLTSCLTCYTLATIDTNHQCNCNDGYYMVINSNPCTASPCSTCTACNAACKTCNGGTSSSCLSCYDGYYLSSNQCLKCNGNCMTCTTNSTNCQSCNTTTYLNPLSNTCDSMCPYGYYATTSNTCIQCNSICATCSVSATTCITCKTGYFLSGTTCLQCDGACATCQTTSTHCLTCPSGTYFSSNTCVSSCASGYYARTTDSTCQACDSSCVTCSDAGISSCESCSSGYYLSPTPTGTCSSCDMTCLTCSTTSTNCLTCKTGSYLYSGSCLLACPDGYYKRISDNTCQTCDSSCVKCSAAGSSACTSCPNGYFLTTGGQCSACSGCATCLTTSTNCLSCTGTTYLYNSQCGTTCPNGYWPRTSDNTCQLCDTSCKTCSSPGTSSACTSCKDGTYLSGSTCNSCSSVCKTCVTTATTCLTCNNGTFLKGTNCLSTCPAGTWGDTSTNTCKTCDTSCLTCQAPGTSTSCLSCSTGLVNGGQCIACTSPCSTCTGTSTYCLSCIAGYFLTSNTCQTTCLAGYYADASSKTCVVCNAACLTCDGMFQTDCLSCSDGYILVSGRCTPCDVTCTTCSGISTTQCVTCAVSLYFQQGSCVATCSTGYYQVESPTKQCIKCSTTCLTCLSNDYQACLTCATNCYFTLFDSLTHSGSCDYMKCPSGLKMNIATMTCVANCPSNEYYDSTYNQCKACNSICASCYGPYSSTCSSCLSPFYLSGTSCLSSCPLAHFPNKDTKKCDNCSANCDVCDNATVCKSCAVGYYYVTETQNCSNTANNGQFVTPSGTIGGCTYGCQTCTTSPQCILCKPSFYLNSQNICTEETHIQPIIRADANSRNLYYLSFNDTWNGFFKNLTNNASSYSISIEGLNTTNYTVNMNYYIFNTTGENWQILVDFGCDTSENGTLIINFYPPAETPYRLTQNQVTADIPPFNTKEANLTIDGQPLIYVSPILSYLSNEPFIVLNLSFSSNFSDFFDIIMNVTNLNIESYSNSTYNYTLNKTDVPTTFKVTLQMFTSILGNPKLTIAFNIPGYIIYHPTHRLSPTNVSISLIDHFKFDSFADSQLKFLDNYGSFIGNVLGPLAVLHGVLNHGSLGYSGIEAVNIIKFLRYMKINYPPNALKTFKADFSDIAFFNPFEITENNEQIPINWAAYGISSNFFANGKDKMLKLCIALILALTFKILEKLFRKKEGFFSKMAQNLSVVFFLNFFLLFYISYMMDLSFYSFVNLKNKYLNSNVGILSLSASIVFIILTVIVITILCKMILGVSWAFWEKKHSIVPLNEPSQDNNAITFEKLPPNSYRDSGKGKGSPTLPSLLSKEQVKRSTWWKGSDTQSSPLEDIIKWSNSKPMITSIPVKSTEVEEGIRKKSKDDISELEKPMEHPAEKKQGLNKSILILLLDFKQISKTQKLYVIFLMVRYFILPLFVLGMYEQTYYLIGCYFGFNLMFLIYIACMNPFEGWCLLIHNIIIEVGIMAAITGALMIYTSEIKGKNEYDDRIFNGSLIYYGNLLVIITLISLYISQILIFIVEKIGGYCANKKNKVQNWADN